jgi:tRNA C32,U32 (ribose-2'-O)-methylase TrmJ
MRTKPEITFALVSPTEPGNAGAAARSLAVFGFRDLRLITPARRPGALDATLAVRWGSEVLRAAPIVPASAIESFLAGYDEIWGTTARIGRQRRVAAADATVAEYLARGGGRLLILFGPERDGLDRVWLDRCHRIVRFPTDAGPLNLAHAVTVMAYELRRQIAAAPAVAPGASLEQRRELLARAQAILARLAYPTRSLRRHPPEAFLEPLRGGQLTRAQARWLLGLFTRLERTLGIARRASRAPAGPESRAAREPPAAPGTG